VRKASPAILGLVFTGLALAGVFIAASTWREGEAHRAIQRGPSADAVVLGPGDCPSWRSCSGKNWSVPSVAVRFYAGDGAPQEANVAVRPNEDHPPGSKLAVRYDPQHPERAEQVGFGWRSYFELGVGIVMALGGLGGAAFLAWRAVRRAALA
jgi:hypothetical protein